MGRSSADVRSRLRSAAALILAFSLLPSGCAASREWACAGFGPGRRCVALLVRPPGTGWDCYVSGGTLACARPTWAAQLPGWTCVAAGAGTVCLAAGAAEPPEASPDGWQGYVAGEQVVMLWRRAGNDPWRCAGAQCVERHPDRPSADEWECVDDDDRVLCRGRFMRGIDPRWRCAPFGDRFLCLDRDPDDPPGGDPRAWRCFYDDSTRTGRNCARGEPRPCRQCPGACVSGRCWTSRGVPGCYFDADCLPGWACRVGICVAP